MKALRIRAFQETACYTRPFANKVTETYPLPPYSTVKGMIHAVMNAKGLIPFSLSIQGDFEAMMIDYRKTYFVKKNTVNMPIIFDGLAVNTPTFSDMTSMPLYTHMLFNVGLVIHVNAEEKVLQKILRAFESNDSFISLGRQEDLVRIDSIELIDLKELDPYEGTQLTHSMYIPASVIQEDEIATGIPYTLNWTYQIKKGIREWNRIPSVYFTKGKLINEDLMEESAFIDTDNYVVIWNE